MWVVPIIAAVAAIGGVVETGIAMSHQPKAPGQPSLPSEAVAGMTADEALTKQRKIALASGGLTDYTKGKGIILGQDVKEVGLAGLM